MSSGASTDGFLGELGLAGCVIEIASLAGACFVMAMMLSPSPVPKTPQQATGVSFLEISALASLTPAVPVYDPAVVQGSCDLSAPALSR